MSEPEHPRRHSEKPARRFLRTYRFELIWLAVVVLGIFLIFERLNIRSAFFAWFRQAARALLRSAGRLSQVIDVFLARTTLSDLIGVVLVLGAAVAILLRVRWRIIHNPALAILRCPQCGGGIRRVHRHKVDHLISPFVPVRRYHCTNDACRWYGLRVGTGHGQSRTSTQESS